MRYLLVGDPHAEASDLQDASALARLVTQLAVAHDATVLLLGDLYHNHSLVNIEVQLFWRDFFQKLTEATGRKAVVLKGNHDAGGVVGSRATALMAHEEQATIVAHGPLELNGMLLCPYTASADQLIEWSNASECPAMVCHQTFDAARYENGYFAKDGVNPNLIKQKAVISGHIHTPQEFGKIWYPGAPRWRTLSDANIDRALWLVDVTNGQVSRLQSFSTAEACRKIHHIVETPQEEWDPTNRVLKDDYRVDSKGPASWLSTREPVFAGWASWRGLRTDLAREQTVKESDGLAAAFGKWVDKYQGARGTSKERLAAMAAERIHVS